MRKTNKILSAILAVFMILSLFSIVAMAQVTGDVNGDGKTTTVDAKWVLKSLSGSKELTDAQKAQADANKDGKISVADARLILKIIAGTVNSDGTGNTGNTGNSDNTVNTGSTGNNSDTAAQYAQEVLKLVNEERAKQGIKALTLSDDLTEVANLKAKDMAVNNYFDHTSPTYGSPFEMMRNFGITFSTAGENIASGQRSPQSVMTSWMNSDGHRANILNPSFTQLGVGYSDGGPYGTVWVQMFIG